MSTLEQQEANVLNEPVVSETAFVEDIVEGQAPPEGAPQEQQGQGFIEPAQEETISVDHEAESRKFQSMYDRSQAENAKLQQGAQILQLLEQRPDLVQTLQDGIANPQSAQESQSGINQDDFNPWEAFTDPNSQSGQHVNTTINSAVSNAVNSAMAQQQQQMQAEMQLNNTVSELRGKYRMSDNDIREFLTFTTQPKEQVGLNSLVKLWQMQNGQSVANNDTMEAVSAAKQAPRTAGVLQGQSVAPAKNEQDRMWDTIKGTGSGTALP